MENRKHSSSPVWILFGVSTTGMLIFAGLYFLNPKTHVKVETIQNTVTNTVVQTLTNEVVKEVPKIVEKTVTVPAEIPKIYLTAANIISNYANADFVKEDQVLFGMDDVQVVYALSDAVKEVVSEDEVRAKFELTLRRNNVPINPKSVNFVTVHVNGLWGANNTILSDNIDVSVYEVQHLARGGQLHRAFVNVWSQGYYGLFSKSYANKALLDKVEQEAELFANDYLSANSKPRHEPDIFDKIQPQN